MSLIILSGISDIEYGARPDGTRIVKARVSFQIEGPGGHTFYASVPAEAGDLNNLARVAIKAVNAWAMNIAGETVSP